MKNHMKKIIVSLLMIICVFALTACQSNEKSLLDRYPEDTKQELIMECGTIVSAVVDDSFNSEENLQDLLLMNDDKVDDLTKNLYSNLGVRMDGRAFINALQSWQDSKDEIGSFKIASINDLFDEVNYEFDVKEDEVIINYNFTGELHSGSIEFIFDKNLHITSATTNVDYSLSECMEKAGMNTLIGMGTVFVMLIVIMFIISILRFVPAIIDGVSAKKEKDKSADVDESMDKAIAGIVEREEEVSDDSELVAAIAAAIAAYEGESSTDGFVVKSIRRIR